MRWLGRCRIGWWASERTADPTFTALAGASTARCKPLDGVNVWDTIATGQSSPHAEMAYDLEPYRAALRQGDWKLVWRTILPTKVELFNLAEDPYEKNNLAGARPEKVAALQQRANELAQGAAKPLFLLEQMKVVMKIMQGQPVLPGEDDFESGDLP